MNIDEGLFLEIYGVPQWVTMRGADLKNPALLMLPGPGASFSRMTPFFAPWEKDFTLVQWDQPSADPLTFARLVRDGIAVTESVLGRLNQEKLVLLATSGGTIAGLHMIRQRPDLFSAYVGTGQIVNWARQDALSYAMVLDRRRARGDEKAVAELEEIGPPPYHDAATDAIKSKYAGAYTPAEQAVFAAVDPAVMAAVRNPPADATYVANGLEPQDMRAVAMKAYEKLRDEILAFDAWGMGLNFEIPMFFFQGADDAYTVTSEVRTYEAAIRAPEKKIVPIPGGGHSAVFMRDDFLRLLNEHLGVERRS